MSKVRGKDTSLEMKVRRLLFDLGYRYRLHVSKLPGRPDIVFPGRRKIIFVHGCFWHRHPGCPKASMPKSHVEYWAEKLSRNGERDREAVRKLKEEGWGVLIVWECETKGQEALKRMLVEFLA
ncbi:DNA mismatch endonuclease Vsr [Acidithiobacillus sp. MC6.1]|nr:DNA mismatch endonuclease Vsr [Acidithiobacillus sp. MC6.1]